jgi:short-subunit dehydrogenase
VTLNRICFGKVLLGENTCDCDFLAHSTLHWLPTLNRNFILFSYRATKTAFFARRPRGTLRQCKLTLIETTHGVKTELVVADFAAGPSCYDVIKRSVEGRDVGVLVNNVGVIPDYPMYLTEVTDLKKKNLSFHMFKLSLLKHDPSTSKLYL